ncbi:hypothetical protein A2U01_0096273, partial [Trifolium medium]|nr:hypothetical protein [Trifolium medium]
TPQLVFAKRALARLSENALKIGSGFRSLARLASHFSLSEMS